MHQRARAGEGTRALTGLLLLLVLINDAQWLTETSGGSRASRALQTIVHTRRIVGELCLSAEDMGVARGSESPPHLRLPTKPLPLQAGRVAALPKCGHASVQALRHPHTHHDPRLRAPLRCTRQGLGRPRAINPSNEEKSNQ